MSFMLQFFVLSLKTAKLGPELHNKISPTSNIYFFLVCLCNAFMGISTRVQI